MQANRKIKLTYPSADSFCKEYQSNLKYGGLYIPTRKPSGLNEIIQVTLTIPEIEEPLILNLRVVQVNDEASAQETGQKPGMALHTVESDLPLIESLKKKLQQVEIYRNSLGLPPPAEEPEKPKESPEAKKPPAAPQKKAAPPAQEKPEKKAVEPPKKETPPQKAKAPEPAAPEEPDSEWKTISSPAADMKPEEEPMETESALEEQAEEEVAEPKPAEEKPVKMPPAPEDRVEPARPEAAPKRQAVKPGRLTDEAIEDLRKIIGEDDSMARPTRKEIKVARPPPEPPRRNLSDQERKRLTPVAKLAMSLVKAMLRTGYYSPDHPGSQDAKQGLYKEYQDAVLEESEISFIARMSREQTDILVGGVLDEPVSLRTVIPGTQAEMFFPKYKDYFERKKLVNFTIKRDIDEKQFDAFIDVMSDPEVDRGEGKQAGNILTRALTEKGITNISAVFEDDLIRLELKLPWRVEMAINRLAKDLKMLPMYQDVTKSEIQKLKVQIIKDIIRPLRQPHMLKDILVNAHVIARKVEDVDPEDLEKTIISCFPLDLLLPTSEFIFAEMKDLKKEIEKNPDIDILKNRLEGVKRVLKHISLQVVEKSPEQALDFLEQLYFNEILTFEELPEAVQERVNTMRMAKDFQRKSAFYIGKFQEARLHEDYILLLRMFRRILPELLDENDFQNIFMLTDALNRAKERDPETLEKLRGGDIAEETTYVWDESMALLKNKFLGAKKETRTGLDEIIVKLGFKGIDLLIQVMDESPDRWVRKSAVDLLIKHGDQARDTVRALLDDPTRPWTLHRNALSIISGIGDSEDVERAARFIRHSDPRLREESLITLSKLEGPASEPRILRIVKDKDPRVRRRAAACLGLFQPVSREALAELARMAQGPEKMPDDEKEKEAEENVRLQAILTLGILGNQPVDSDRDVEDVLIELISPGKGWAKKLIRRVAKVGDQSERIQAGVVDTLSRIGTAKSKDVLNAMLETAGSAMTSKIKDAVRHIEARLASGKTPQGEAPEVEPGQLEPLPERAAFQPPGEPQPQAAGPGEGGVLDLDDEVEDLVEELTEEVAEKPAAPRQPTKAKS